LIDLAKQFVPTTDEVWRLQGAQDNDANIFQEMANKGHYRRVGGSRQGIYVCTPKGDLLSSINSLDADVVLNTVKTGLEKWHELPLTERSLPENYLLNASHRWENSYPEDGLVLTSYNIDIFTDPPMDEDATVGILTMYGSIKKNPANGYRIIQKLETSTNSLKN